MAASRAPELVVRRLTGMIAKIRGDVDEAKDAIRRWSRCTIGKQVVFEKRSSLSRLPRAVRSHDLTACQLTGCTLDY
jgi:hypothetical protein